MAGRCPLCHNKNPGMTKINFAVPGFFVSVRGMGYISRISASYDNLRQVAVPARGTGCIAELCRRVEEQEKSQSPRGVQIASAKEYKQIAVF